jgi:hypothetical protein
MAVLCHHHGIHHYDPLQSWPKMSHLVLCPHLVQLLHPMSGLAAMLPLVHLSCLHQPTTALTPHRLNLHLQLLAFAQNCYHLLSVKKTQEDARAEWCIDIKVRTCMSATLYICFIKTTKDDEWAESMHRDMISRQCWWLWSLAMTAHEPSCTMPQSCHPMSGLAAMLPLVHYCASIQRQHSLLVDWNFACCLCTCLCLHQQQMTALTPRRLNLISVHIPIDDTNTTETMISHWTLHAP